MGIADRLINIAKMNLNFSKKTDDYFENIDIDEILADEKDEELKKIIDELNDKNINNNVKYFNETKKEIPEEVKNVFLGLNAEISSTYEEVKTIFKKELKRYHPDKHSNLTNEKRKFLEEKTMELIKSFNVIKKYKENDF